MKLSVVIITKNAESHIENCLETVKWADEIIIVDAYSSDKTTEICKKYTDKIFQNDNSEHLHNNFNWGFEKAQNPWILAFSPDERITPELRVEIQEKIKTDNAKDGYYLPRKNYFLGKWIRGCGWYPDYGLRLFRKGKGLFPCKSVHEDVIVTGEVGYLKNSFLHYSYRSLQEYLQKLMLFSNFESRYILELKNNQLTYKWGDFFKNPQIRKLQIKRLYWKYCPLKSLIKFVWMYFIKRGFIDGKHGFVLCVLGAFAEFTKQTKAWWELQNARQSRHR